MRRLFRWDKKYLYWGVTAFLVIAASIVFYMLLHYIPAIGSLLSKLFGILAPFVLGFVLTYLLLPLMKKLDSLFRRKSGKAKWPRTVAIIICEIVLCAVLAALVLLILPQLYSSIEMIVINSPSYLASLSDWLEKILRDYPEVESYVSEYLGNFNQGVLDLVRTEVLPSVGSLVTSVTSGVYSVAKAIYNLVIGIIVSVYVLANHETVGAWARKILYSIFSIDAAQRIREAIQFIDRTFIGFINGKLLDSLIIGIICYVVCAILGMPYTLLVSVIVGVTNIIPFFGPLIGAVPAALIILMVSPIKCLIFVIFIIILQQIDGNILGPKILGNSVGINGFWVMFSIVVGAGLFGFWGMLLGVPVWVVVYTLVCNSIDKKLKRSDLPVEPASYYNLDYIDPATRELHQRKEEEFLKNYAKRMQEKNRENKQEKKEPPKPQEKGAD